MQVGDADTVTALVTNYNYGRYLENACSSVAGQTSPVDQIVIVDDGSTDDSGPVLDKLEARYAERLVVVRQANTGQAGAINAGLELATGDIVAMLDADDAWAPTKVATVKRAFAANPAVGMVQHPLRLVDGKGVGTKSYATRRRGAQSGDLLPLLIATGGANVFEPTSGLSFRRATLEQFFPLPVNDWRICADGALAYGAAVFSQIVSLREELGDYRIHNENAFAGRAPEVGKLSADLEMTCRYINSLLERRGVQERVSLEDRMDYRRFRYYQKRGAEDFWAVLRQIDSWPLYSSLDRLRFKARFLAKSLLLSLWSPRRHP